MAKSLNIIDLVVVNYLCKLNSKFISSSNCIFFFFNLKKSFKTSISDRLIIQYIANLWLMSSVIVRSC